MWDMRVSDPIPPPLSRSAIPVARGVGTSPVFVLNKVSDAGGTPATSVPLRAQGGPALTLHGRLLQTTPLTGETLPETRPQSVHPEQLWDCSIPSRGPEQTSD